VHATLFARYDTFFARYDTLLARYPTFLTRYASCTLFSSPELKAQVSYSDRPLSVIRLSIRLSVNFYIFDFFSRTTGPILTKLGTNHP
jgi:hypothetical protein